MNKHLYDVVIVGGGPAGLTAAIYLARAKYRVLVVEKEKFGGQITITEEVVNYPGVEKTSGSALTESMRKQAENFGAEFLLADVDELVLDQDIKTIKTSRGEKQAYGVLLATGARPRAAGFVGEQEFKGHGVAYCATCDGEFFTDKEVFVIGGGFAAAEEAVFLTKYASHVTMLILEEDFICAKSVAQKARDHEKITVKTRVQVQAVNGDNGLNYIKYKHLDTDEVVEYKSDDYFGLFVFAGYVPENTLVKDKVELNPQGYIVTDEKQQTSIEGVFAAGDVCIKDLRQVVTATADGALAASALEKYASKMQEKTGITPEFAVAKQVEEKVETQPVVETSIITPEMQQQLNAVFGKMENDLVLELHLDDRAVSQELEMYMNELASLTSKLSVKVVNDSTSEDRPCVLVKKNDEYVGTGFHGVPGGHEFTSFVLGLYNASGPGQSIDPNDLNEVKAFNERLDLKIIVSLSCTMCPDLVVAAQRLAVENENMTVHIYDIAHFPELKEKYNVMSVPCMVLNETKVTFGKKNIPQIIEWIKK